MPAERRSSPLIVGGGAAVAALLALYLFIGSGADEPPPAPPATQPAPSPVAPVAVAPQPAPAATSPQGLRLYGIAGAGAIIGLPDGGQRLFLIGRDVLPGLTLASVGVDHAMLRSSAGTYRLGFDGVTAGQAAPRATPSQPQGVEAAVRDETLRYRHGLAPVTESGRVTGHVVRAGTPMLALERAGIRPGDVILRVNGSQLNEEQREELAWTLVHSSEVTFEIVRDGRPMSLTVAR